jgi:hypothetical protein
MRKSFALAFMVCAVGLPALAQNNVVISEFMASNNRGLLDENAEFSDWIEIHNAGTNTVNLLNWALTDTAGNPFQWRFPATNINAGQYLIVFASNKDRRTPGAPLHTNFRLDAGGEYLALVRPDGTIATEFNQVDGGFPAQVPNVSFGTAVLSTNYSAILSNSPARVLIPTAGTPTTWTATNFDDSSWIQGINGVGYGATNATQIDYGAAIAPTQPIGYWRLNETSGAAANTGSGVGLNGTYTTTTLGTAGPRSPAFGGFEPNNNAPTFNGSASGSTGGFVAVNNNLLNNLSAFTIAGWIRPVTTGNRIGLFGQNDCVEFGFINATTLQCWTPGTGGSVNAAYGQPLGTWHHVTAVGNGSNIRIFIDGNLIATGGAGTANYGSSAFNFNIGGGGIFDTATNFFNGQIDEVVAYHRALSDTEIQSLYQAGLTPVTASVVPFVNTDVNAAMSNINATAYIRLPFVIANPTNVSLLTLRMRYDDGFAASINGTELVRANAPATLAYNSAATNVHSPLQVEEFRLGTLNLVPGTNILALHGLNRTADDSDFLVAAELLVTSVAGESPNPVYFTVATPGAANTGGVAVPGPAILEPDHSPPQPSDGDDIVVKALLLETFNPISSVVLRYKVMFGSVLELPMFDDGLHGDGASNDMVFAATIPASASTNGQMVRWYFRATDTLGNVSRWPLFSAPTETEYLGTMITDPSVVTKLPVVYLFADPTVLQPGPTTSSIGADSQNGARGVSVFHDGEFYDNIMVAVRGNTTATYNKKSHRFEFNPDHGFRHSGPGGRLLRTSFVADYPDPAYMRQGLCYWLANQIGCPAPFYIPHRLQLNGRFYQLANHNDVSGREMLDRLGYNSQGALYNAAGVVVPGMFSTGGFEKKTREWETGNVDYLALANAIAETLSVGQRRTNVFEQFDIPQVINYLVTARWGHENDDVWANMSLYHDNDGDNLWRTIPFDMNLSWGAIFYEGGTPSVIEGVQATNDIHKAHPLYGSSAAPALSGPGSPNNFNRVYEAFFMIPQTREMFLRRMRSMMDTYVLPPGTPAGASPIEKHVLALREIMFEDANRDRAFWGWPTKGGQCNFDPGISFTNGVNGLLGINAPTNFFQLRREHFYGKHSVANGALQIGITKTNNAGIPLDQPGDAVMYIAAMDVNPSSANQDHEYIALTNPQPYAVDISAWKLSGAVDFTFQLGTVVPSNSVVYVSPNVRAFRARATTPRGNQGHFVVGPYQGQLSARGETIILHDQYGRLVHTNSYLPNPSPAQRFLRVTEIMYSPAAPPSGPYGREDFEYIELKNIGASTLFLSNVRFTNGISFNFTGSAVVSLNAGQTVLVVRNTNAFRARYPSAVNIAGEFTGALDNGGERIRLIDALGEEILDFKYENDWYPITDGYGFSLVTANENQDPDLWDDKSGWRPSGQIHGSPGANDPAPPVIAPVRINEVLAHTDFPQTDFVELYNPTASLVDISGWFLSDDITNVTKFRIPDGTTIQPGGYISFDESDFNPNPGGTPGFAFSSRGDEVVLASADTIGNLTGYLQSYDFGDSENGVSFGPHVTSTGEEHFVPQASVTRDGVNSGPKVGPIIISEIMYRPADDASGDNSLDEYIELQNTSASTVALSETTNSWKLDKGVDFDFPLGTTVATGARLLVVNFDPANAAQLAAFRSRYGIGGTVPVFGPYEGKLDNSGERIDLQKPNPPETNGEVRYVTIERVDYRDTAPWPAGADGTGASLQRSSPTSYYNDPASWVAAVHTAGGNYIGGTPPSITAQPDNQVGIASFNATFTVGAAGSSPFSYQWFYGNTPIPGATAQTLQLTNLKAKDAGQYSVAVFNGAGYTLSANAFLTVLIPARLTSQPTNIFLANGSTNPANFGISPNNAVFRVGAESSSPISYQWYFNSNLIAGAAGPILTITNPGLDDNGFYDCTITDSVGMLRSTPARLTVGVVPFISSPYPEFENNRHLQPLVALVGESATFTVVHGGTGFFGYRWRRNSAPILTNQVPVFTIQNVQLSDAGNYTVIVTNQANSSPGILSPPGGGGISLAPLAVYTDADNDKAGDAWETRFGFSPGNPDDGRLDSDGDGASNADEFRAGTDPTDPLSVLKVDQFTLTGTANVTFLARATNSYSVQYRTGLGASPWLPLTNITARTTDRTVTVTDPAAATNRFYRLVTPLRQD